MRMSGRYETLSLLDAAMLSLKEIEESLNADELKYIYQKEVSLAKHTYENTRLFYTIMGLQRIVKYSNGSFLFSKLPDCTISPEDKYFKSQRISDFNPTKHSPWKENANENVSNDKMEI